jgi:hypothetical protein
VSDTPREPCQDEQNAPPGGERAPLLMTLTCLAPRAEGVSEGSEKGSRGKRPSVVVARCVRPRPVRDWRTGEIRLMPCGRPRCSWQCRDLWARRMSAALRRSFGVLPPTHFVRVTALDVVSAVELTRCVGRFLRRLRRRGCEYLVVNEWQEGQRHHHVLVRTDGELTGAVVAELWRDSCRGARGTSYCRPVTSVEAAARYVVKDLSDGSKKEVPPSEFGGKLFSSSRQFLAEPLKVLLRAVREEWRAEAQSRTERHQRGDSAGVTALQNNPHENREQDSRTEIDVEEESSC